MKYYFSDFVLDTDKNELHRGNQVILLTKQNYQLLLYFLQNSEKIHSKDALVSHVWQGRIVSDNTIDQSISKLRKTLNTHQVDDYFETVYGQGVKFMVPVQTQPPDQNSNTRWPVLLLLLLLPLLGLSFWYFNSTDELRPKPHLVFLSEADDSLPYAIEDMFSQLINYSGTATVVDYGKKPEQQDEEQYLSIQRKFTPGLTAIRTKLSRTPDNYTIELSLNNSEKQLTQTAISSPNIHTVLQQGSQWIIAQIEQPEKQKQLATLISDNDHVSELYLRGLNSLNYNEFDKAKQQFELLLKEEPTYHLARYQLAAISNVSGDQKQALAHLATLTALALPPELHIDAISLQADILDTQGRHQESVGLLHGLLKEHQTHISLPLQHVRFHLSHVYLNMNEYELAMQQLNHISENLSETENVDLLADVYELKGRLMQKTGQLSEAKINAENALGLFERMGDLLGAAKTYTLLARIASHHANYPLATEYLEQSLAITESLKYPLGEGATLNELIYVLMVQGQHNKAWRLNQRLEQIAIEIDYNAMLMASKQLFFDMAREQKKWPTAERYLKQHAALAKASQNQRGLINNQLLTLSFLLDQRKRLGVSELINSLQQHIDKNQEIRLQPRLDTQLARYHFLSNNTADGMSLLNAAKEKAEKTEDGETLIVINNLLAEQFLSTNQPDKAMAVLTESDQFNPFALPHLKLKAESLLQQNANMKALETINLAKQQAADLWTEEYEYLRGQIIAATKKQ